MSPQTPLSSQGAYAGGGAGGAMGDRTLGERGAAMMLKEWWDELLWPRVLWAAKLGLRPGRLGLAFVAVVVAGLLIEAGVAVDGRIPHTLAPWPWEVVHEPDGFVAVLWTVFLSAPKALLLRLPVTTLVVGPLLLAIWTALVGAISRMTACEVALDESLSWVDGLKFAAARWWALVGAVLGPLVLAWVVAGAIVAAGVLARWPVTNLVFAVGYGAALLGAFFAVMVLVVYVLGKGMLIPAVVCEGTDAIDAIQKAYRFVLARPGRTVWYFGLGTLGVAVVCGIVWVLVVFTIGFAARASGVWAGDGHRMIWWPTSGVLNGLGVWSAAVEPEPLPVGAGLVRLWTLVPALLFFASVVSCGTAASTVMYLAMRRVCDGQDVAELWAPGMIAGSMLVSMEGRGAAARAAGFGVEAASVAYRAEES